MHEVELVLRVVVVQETVVAGRHHDRVHAEGGHAERASHLAEAVPVAELVDRAKRPPPRHRRFTMSSASSRVKARRVSVCSAPCRWSFIKISIATSSSGVGTRSEMPSILPFTSGITRPVALAAPVVVGMMLSAAAKATGL